MDAATIVNVAALKTMGDALSLKIYYDTSGQHQIILRVDPEDRKEYLVHFQAKEWSDFKTAVIAIDEAVRQLRAKDQIFNFSGGPPSHRDEPQLPPEPKPGEEAAINIDYFMCSKVTASGERVMRECRSANEIEEFKRAVV